MATQCPACGLELPQGQAFCEDCGTPLAPTPTAWPPPTAPPTSPADDTTADRRNGAKTILLSTLGILALGGVTAAALVAFTDIHVPVLSAFDSREEPPVETRNRGTADREDGADAPEPAAREGEADDESRNRDATPAPAQQRAVALAESVEVRLEGAGLDAEAATVTCPAIERFVAGDLITCEVATARDTDRPAAALVTIHEADGTHVVTPWTDDDEPPDIDEVVSESGGSGQFCRDVDAAGFNYSVAVAYWLREGEPGRMDADDDGIPCGTVYDTDVIDTYWENVRPLPATEG